MNAGAASRRRSGVGETVVRRWVPVCCLGAVAAVALALLAGVPLPSLPSSAGGGTVPWVALLPLGALGMVAHGDVGEELTRLAAKVQRAATGEADDVEFATDRTDELGDLYEAVEALAARARDGESRARDGREFRERLFEVTADPETDDETRVQRLLELGCERLGLGNGLVARIDEPADRYEMEFVHGSDFGEAGSVTGLADTFCRKAIAADGVVGIYDAVEAGYAEDPGHEVWNVGSYVGATVTVGGELYGTVCFVDEEPRDRPFTGPEREFVESVARAVSQVLERRVYTGELRRTDRAMDAAPVGITITGSGAADTPIVYANEAFEETTGYDAESVLGRNVRFMRGEGTSDEAAAALDAAIENEERRTVELRNYRADGTTFLNRARIAPVEDDEGEVTNFVVFHEDVTERREQARQLEAIVHNTDNAIYIKDRDGTYEFVNEAVADFFDADPADVVGKHDADIFDADSTAEVRDHDDRVLETGESLVEEVVRVVDGEEHVFLDEKYPYRDEDGGVVGVMGVSRDVTERKERERELERERDRFATLFDSLPNPALHAVAEGGEPVVRNVNAAFEESFGYETAELQGERLHDFVAPGEADEELAALNREILGEGELQTEVERETVDGTRTFQLDVTVQDCDEGPPEGYVVYTDVTERKERERDLESQASLLDSLFEQIPINLYVKDEAGRHLRTSTPHLREGYPDDEEWFRGKTDLDVYPGELAEETYADDMRVIESGESIVEKLEFDPTDDEWLLTSKVPWRTEDGDVRGLIGVSQNVTDRKERERELRETKRRLELALEGTSTGVWEWNPETGEVAWNETLEKLVGLEPGEFGGTLEAFRRRVHPDDWPQVEATNERAVEAAEPYRTEFRMRHEDGSWIWVGARGRVVEEDGDRRVVGINNDVTERKRREQQLRERERDLERYREYTDDVLDAVDDVFYVLDADGELQRWNESLCEVTGYDGEEIAEMNALEFFAAEDRERIAAAIREVFETGDTRFEAPFLTKAGESIPHEFVASRLEDPDGDPVLTGIGRDVTERNRYEQELERTTDLLQQVQEMASVGGWELDVSTDPPESTWTEEMYRLHDLPRDADVDVETIVERYHPDDRERVRETIEASVENGTGYDIEARMLTGSDETRWVRAFGTPIEDGDRVVAFRGAIQDVTGQKEREAELERTKELLQQAGRMAKFGGWELDLTADPPEMDWSDELYEIHGLEPGVEVDVETTLAQYHPEDREYMRERFRAAIEDGEGYDMEVRALVGDETRWVRALGEPVYEDGTVVKLRGSIQDITTQKERELALESLHDATQGLLQTESDREVAELVVGVAADVLDVPGASVYLLDSDANRLEPAAFTGGFVDHCDGTPSVPVGSDSVVWTAFVEGTPTAFDRGDLGEESPFGPDVAGGLVVPIGAHGAFVVTARTAAVGDETRRLVETLVATTEAAFDRLESEASLRERDAELEARNRRLRRQIQITDIIRGIDRTLIGADSREEIQRSVCDRLVEADDVAFAWIGEPGAGGQRLVPREWAGSHEGYLDAIDLDLDPDGAAPEPAVATARSESPTMVSNVLGELNDEPWRTRALAEDFHSVVSVPLSFDEYFYGVLTVYADEPDGFGDLERTVFTELGTSIANSVTAVETHRSLHADVLVELRLRLSDADSFLARVARDADCRVGYEGIGARANDRTQVFFTTAGASAAAVEATLAESVAVSEYRLITESEDGALFEATVGGDVLPARLVRHGGRPRSIDATGATMEVVVDVPATVDVREFVEMLHEAYRSVELVGRREVERSVHTRQGLVASLLADLTDRQRETLRTAYFAGFFEWPRQSTGEDVAEMLGVTQPTVNRHLRLAQQRLLRQLLEARDPE